MPRSNAAAVLSVRLLLIAERIAPMRSTTASETAPIGRICWRTPMRASTRRPRATFAIPSNLKNSSRTRSGEDWRSAPAPCRISAAVSGCIFRSNWALNLTPRSARIGSFAIESGEERRSTFLRRSARPLSGSINALGSPSKSAAIAFIVKSRSRRSSSSVAPRSLAKSTVTAPSSRLTKTRATSRSRSMT